MSVDTDVSFAKTPHGANWTEVLHCERQQRRVGSSSGPCGCRVRRIAAAARGCRDRAMLNPERMKRRGARPPCQSAMGAATAWFVESSVTRLRHR
eukprot:5184431-Prymnesium_polylepis.2